jgi:hypothetical protein
MNAADRPFAADAPPPWHALSVDAALEVLAASSQAATSCRRRHGAAR